MEKLFKNKFLSKGYLSLFLTCLSLEAEEFLEEPNLPWKERFEVYTGYTIRSPTNLWGPIKEVGAQWLHKWSCSTTLQVALTGFDRYQREITPNEVGFPPEGNGALLSLGCWHDWSDCCYTFCAIARGSNSTYLPEFRFDGELYWKFGTEKNIIIPLGVTYLRYYFPQLEWCLSSGLNYYYCSWVFSYRLFWHLTSPGDHQALSHKIALMQGKEGAAWNTLVVSFGREAFDTSYTLDPITVNRASFGFSFERRQWIGCNWGCMLKGSYTWVESPYILYQGVLGFFYDY